jgi:hypothetical protein
MLLHVGRHGRMPTVGGMYMCRSGGADAKMVWLTRIDYYYVQVRRDVALPRRWIVYCMWTPRISNLSAYVQPQTV